MDIVFLNTAEFKQYVSIDAETKFTTLKGFIEEAAEDFIIELVGNAEYTALFNEYNLGSGTPASLKYQNLLAYVQRPLAFYTMYLAQPELAVNVGDSGITEYVGEDRAAAPKYKQDSLRFSYLDRADKAAEKLLAFLEKHATTYTDWAASDANTQLEGLIVPTASVADEHIDINGSRRIFKRLKKRIKDIEGRMVPRLISTAEHNTLTSAIKTDNLSTEQRVLIDRLRPIISKKALFETLPSMKVVVGPGGITVYSSSDGVVTKSAASKDELEMLKYSLKDSDTGYMKLIDELQEFLELNADNYAGYKESTAFTSRADPGPGRPPENSKDRKHFSV
ncbi:MAG: DUF6712 family protein [Bacteroidota bacterium]